MPEGVIKTTFVGDASGQLAAEAALRKSQKDLQSGWKAFAEQAKQSGGDVRAMFDVIEQAVSKFLESQNKVKSGWAAISQMGREAYETSQRQAAELERLRLGYERLGAAGRAAMQSLSDERAREQAEKLKGAYLGAVSQIEAGFRGSAASIRSEFVNVNRVLGDVTAERQAKEQAEKFAQAYLGAAQRIEAGFRSTAKAIRSEFVDVNRVLGDVTAQITARSAQITARETAWLKSHRLNETHLTADPFHPARGSHGPSDAGWLRDLDEAIAKTRQATEVQKKHNEEVKQSSGLTQQWGRYAMGVASSYLGIQEAIQFAMDARQKYQQMEDEAASKQMKAAQAHERIFTNVGSDKKAFDWLLAEMQSIGREFGISDQDALARLMETTTSKMAGDAKKGAEIARVTAAAKRFSVGTEGSQYAIGIANLMQAIPGISAEQASSMLLGLGTEASIVQQAMLSQYITPTALAGMATSDLTKVSRMDVAREGLAGAATLAKFAGDEEGRTASTNWNLFSYATQEFIKEKGLPDAGTAMRRVDAMTDEQLAEFEKKLGGDARLKPFVTLMAIKRDKEMRGFFDTTMEAIQADPGRHRRHAEQLTSISGAAQVATHMSQIEAEGELAALDRTPAGLVAAARKAYIDAQTELQSRQPGAYLHTKLGQWIGDLSLVPNLTGDANEVRARKAQIQAQRRIAVPGAGPGTEYHTIASPTLDRLEKKFDELIAALETNSETTKENTESTAGGVKADQKRRERRP